ncbi:uncharacterized protein IL334_006068 [Kwoniella shivajii]|uniref:t-SNARE coiled-coil homology domain-containing protein n=1 Tax=Kwoniella shivajii TaxID=564305 RepID=A0ABZ1D4W0_9TREE|nr:hypothetical protein IL334_006068 [Kwoniella shivajii]
MPSIDHTHLFKDVLSEKSSQLPPSSRSKSPSRLNVRSASRKGKGKESDLDEEEFLKESYRIYNHLLSLQHLLTSVRKPYLSTVEPPPLSRRSHKENKAADEDEQNEWKKWERVKYLTDRERDEIDLRARMILRRCKERVNALEISEHARKSKTPSTSSAKATVLSFLPSLLPSESSSSFPPLINAHRASVLWTLNDYLARLTSTVSDLQEERSKRREERSKTLGSGASIEASRMNNLAQSQSKSVNHKIPDGIMVGVDDPAFTTSDSHLSNGNGYTGGLGIMNPSDVPIEDQITSSQIQSFENENNVLLEHMSSTLSSVLSAESSLLEISQLQSELVRHLSQQTEMVDQLYEDAVGSVSQVGKANEQLKKARERGKEGRLFLLVFLIGASLGLLFLDWYAA